MKRFILQLFAFIFISSWSTAQEKVSSFENFVHLEESIFDDDLAKISWQNTDYILLKLGTILTLINQEDPKKDKLEIDLGVTCVSFYPSFSQVDNNTLFLATSNSILEIDLLEQKLIDTHHLDSEERIKAIKKDNNDGLLVVFDGATNVDRKIARIDLLTDEIAYKIVPASRTLLPFGDFILSLTYDNFSVIAYNLATNTEIVILEDDEYIRVANYNFTNELYFSNMNGYLYRITNNLDVELRCTDYIQNGFDTGIILDDFLYKTEYINSNPAIKQLSILDLTSCEIVKSYIPNGNFDPNSLDDYKGEFCLLNSTNSILKFNYETFGILEFETPPHNVAYNILEEEYSYNISISQNDELVIYRLNLETNQDSSFNTGIDYNFINRFTVDISGGNIFVVTKIKGKYISIHIDSLFQEVSRTTLTDPKDVGLLLPENQLISSNEVPNLLYNNKILFLTEDELTSLNGYKYHQGAIYQEDIAYGYINRNDSTFFTVASIDNLILEQSSEPQSFGYNFNIFRANGRVYRIFNDGIKEIYPFPAYDIEELPYEIKEVHHQFADKVLVTAESDNIEYLAFFNGSEFNIISDEESTYFRLDETYYSWRNNETIKIMIFDLIRGVERESLVLSFNETTGEVYMNEKVENMGIINRYQNQKDKYWKSLVFNTRFGNESMLGITNGKELIRFPFTEIQEIYGWAYNYSYSNGNVFYSSGNNLLAVNRELEVKQIDATDSDARVQDVKFINDSYYVIRQNDFEVTVYTYDSLFQSEQLLFKSEQSDCVSIRDNYFLDLLDEDKILMVLNTRVSGKELWQLEFSTQEVRLFQDANPGSGSGFDDIRFYHEDYMYYTAISNGLNTQLYKVKIDNGLLNATEELELSQDLRVYPNPANEIIYPNIALQNIEIVSMNGATVFLNNSQNTIPQEILINNLPSGFYVLSGIDENGNLRTTKFCKF